MAAPAKLPNMLYYGDNLPILRNRDYFPSESVDLVYLDPPFNSNQDYNVLFQEQDGSRSAAQIRAFDDTWRWDEGARRAFDETVEQGGRAAEALLALEKLVGHSDMLAYLSMMAPRLVELRRVLKPTGTVYLHCDPTASHYLKLLMDSVFGGGNFQNEIVWKRTHSHGGAERYGPIHDTILFYSKSDEFTWRTQFTPYSQDYLDSFFTHEDEKGRYRLTILTGPGTRQGSSGKPWHGINPTASGRHWAVPGFLRPLLEGVDPTDSQAALEVLDSAGRLHWPKKTGGVPSLMQYVTDMQGAPVQDVWTDIPPISSQAAERLGYPTQKPEALLERIISASSDSGQTVLDPFCGCGTSVAAAQKLGRRWVGIDITHLAITLIRSRLADAYGDAVSYTVVGEPADETGARTLAGQDRYQFQWWALGKIGARPVTEERKKGADTGIDGKLFFREKENGPVKSIVIQVKSGALKLSEVRDFAHVIDREKAQIGVLLSLDEPTRDMRTEAAGMGYYKPEYRLSEDDKYDRYQILTVREVFEGKQPKYPPFRNVTFRPAPEAKPAKTRTGRTHRLSAKSATGSEPRTSLDALGK